MNLHVLPLGALLAASAVACDTNCDKLKPLPVQGRYTYDDPPTLGPFGMRDTVAVGSMEVGEESVVVQYELGDGTKWKPPTALSTASSRI